MKYAIFFIPHLSERKKLSQLRSKLCKKYKSNKALQYPVHMTLTLGVEIKNYSQFERKLREFCKTKRKRIIRTEKYTGLSSNKTWCGIHILENRELIDLKKNLQKIIDKYSVKKRRRNSPLHMTLVYQTDLSELTKLKVPLTKFNFDRITLVKKKDDEKYKIHKHLFLK